MVYTSEYPIFYLVADVALFATVGDELHVLMVRRAGDTEGGKLAFPGGFVDAEEPLEAAARRELAEETGLKLDQVALNQLATYGTPGRDPRGRVVSVVYLAMLPEPMDPIAGSDAADAGWHPVAALLAEAEQLAFDHHQILVDAVARLSAVHES